MIASWTLGNPSCTIPVSHTCFSRANQMTSLGYEAENLTVPDSLVPRNRIHVVYWQACGEEKVFAAVRRPSCYALKKDRSQMA